MSGWASSCPAFGARLYHSGGRRHSTVPPASGQPCICLTKISRMGGLPRLNVSCRRRKLSLVKPPSTWGRSGSHANVTSTSRAGSPV